MFFFSQTQITYFNFLICTIINIYIIFNFGRYQENSINASFVRVKTTTTKLFMSINPKLIRLYLLSRCRMQPHHHTRCVFSARAQNRCVQFYFYFWACLLYPLLKWWVFGICIYPWLKKCLVKLNNIVRARQYNHNIDRNDTATVLI